MNQVMCVLSGNPFAYSKQQHLPQSGISKTAHHCTSLSSLQKYLNSSFPMPHSLPTVTENIPKATSHPLVWLLWHSAVSADPHMHICLNTQTHQPPPLSHREGWPEPSYLQLGSAVTGGIQAHEGSGISAVTCAVPACRRSSQFTGWVCQRPVGQGAEKHPGEDVCPWLMTLTLVKILLSHCS